MGRKRRTKSVLIAEALAEDIRVGKYKEATIFPSVRMLARRFDVAFETARGTASPSCSSASSGCAEHGRGASDTRQAGRGLRPLR